MKIYKVEVNKCEYSCSDCYNYLIEEKYFINQKRAKEYLASKITEYYEYNKTNMSEYGLGQCYSTTIQEIKTVD